jgi:hypothetical protein
LATFCAADKKYTETWQVCEAIAGGIKEKIFKQHSDFY